MELLDGVIQHSNNSSHVHFIVRVVDDFLCISTEQEAVIRFLEKAHAGIPSLGIQVNEEKSRCSFDFQSDTISVQKVVSKDVKGNQYFSWCGLLFDISTGSVHVDYDRFSGNHAVDSLLINHGGSDGLHLVTKMRGFVRPRALPLLYDLRVNTVDDIHLNYCQAVVLCAIKTHAYVQQMDGGYEKNPAFLVSAMEQTLEYFYHTIRSRIKLKNSDMRQTTDSPYALLSKTLTLQTAKWLGLYIFASVLKKEKITGEHTMIITSRYRSLTVLNVNSLKLMADESIESFYAVYLKDGC